MVGVPNLCFEVFKNGFVQLVTILLTKKNTLCVYVSFEVTVSLQLFHCTPADCNRQILNSLDWLKCALSDLIQGVDKSIA